MVIDPADPNRRSVGSFFTNPIVPVDTLGTVEAGLMRRGKLLHLIHITGRMIRNLGIYELIIGGDCWDRGPRGDLVVDYLRRQPNVSFIWGNHDAAWLGACLGQEACIRPPLTSHR